MLAWLRLAWICLLAIALPVQGTLAATMAACGPQGQDAARLAAPHASAPPTAHGGHHHPLAQAASVDATGHGSPEAASHHHAAGPAHAAAGAVDAADADSPGASSCSVCAACCAGASLPAQAIVVAALPAATAPPMQAEAHAPVFLTAAPERPPRALAA